MSNKDVLKLYKIEMINYAVFTDREPRKTFLGGGDMESFFDLSLNDPGTIENEIIPVIDNLISGHSPIDPSMAEFGGIDYFVIAYLDGVYFFDPNTNHSSFNIPLEHFKAIATEWMNFLRKPINI